MIEPLRPGASSAFRSVHQLVREVGDLLATRFVTCAVRGEISGFSRAASGHCYFNLKDSDGAAALVRCAMFRRTAAVLPFAPADGQAVELRGRLGIYEPRGELQLVVEAMQQAGAGTLYEQFLLRKARLESQGLFAAERKRSVPAFARSVGIVTSLDAAALHDVLTTLARRAPHVGVVVYPSLVQGADAPAALVQAIGAATLRGEVDVLIVCRGGGSLEDLWAFNDEAVVRAIVAASMPVICGVGHETDVTLADFAADLRAPTPTAAAEIAVPLRQACIESVTAMAALMRRRVQDALEMHSQRLDRAALRLSRPTRAVQAHTQRLALLAHRLAHHLPRTVSAHRERLVQSHDHLRRRSDMLMASHRQRLDGLAARLRALDPKQVLARGYAWLSDDSGRAVTSVDELSQGDRLQAILNDGSAEVLVAQVRGRTSR